MGEHPDLPAERAYLGHAYECLAAMRRRTAGTVAAAERQAREEPSVEAGIVLWHVEQRARDLAEVPAALCFGRLDPAAGGERLYVGRRHVEDTEANPVVVDWRARASAPFYRATFADPLDLARRRRFVFDGRALVDLFDDDFTDPDSAGHGGGLPDPLLAELERARTGEMGDIVATIQAEQDLIIRAPLDETIVVQGGPGTGKTAVGLHRAAFLLYEHRELLERRRVLIVGPNRIFLRYIAQVLPSLGETAVLQATLDGLVAARWPVRAAEAPAVERLKGDLRMAGVARAAVLAPITVPDADLAVATGFGTVRLPAQDVADVQLGALGGSLPANEGRELFRQQLVRLAWRHHAERPTTDPASHDAFVDDLRTSPDFRRALDRLWPSMSAPAVVRRLLGNRRVLAACADGILEPGEQALLHRRPARRIADERWSLGDLGLLDEVEALTAGVPVTYGHLVVDEAQDLSSMALRMLARRCPARSMTVLGDLAQATSVAAQTSWDGAVAALDAPKARVEELAVGYRVPAPIMDFANRLLPVAAPGVRPSGSVRTSGEAPLVVQVPAGRLGPAVAAEVAALVERWTSVGVIAPSSRMDGVAAALRDAGLPFGDGRRSAGLDAGATLLEPPSCKGLEFDAVVVVEPGVIVAEEPNGHRILYVALTRAVQHLGVVHAEPLPAPLR